MNDSIADSMKQFLPNMRKFSTNYCNIPVGLPSSLNELTGPKCWTTVGTSEAPTKDIVANPLVLDASVLHSSVPMARRRSKALPALVKRLDIPESILGLEAPSTSTL
jgi:hypothetical protein